MKVYIASSWRNAAGVEMLTTLLRDRGLKVDSWIENNYGEDHNHVTKKMDFDKWVNSPESNQSFAFDTLAAVNCDVFIYYGPAGPDATAELGAAWGSRTQKEKIIFGLWAKGEPLGLMRKMVDEWYERPSQLIWALSKYIHESKEQQSTIL